MVDFIVINEGPVRLGFFLGVFVLVAAAEVAFPRRKRRVSKLVRWLNNILLVVLNTMLVRVLFGAVGVALSLTCQERGWGLFNNVDLPVEAAIVGTIVLMDFIIYMQHVMFHAVPILWRLHRMHHQDLDFDVTLGLRFHPIEIIISMLIKMAAIILLGPPVVAVIVFEVILNGTAMFNHGNLRLPRRLDRWLRLVVVTPDMHRVHHSVEAYETNSNFGFNLPWWDRLFGTYRPQPERGHEQMVVGLEDFREPRFLTLPWMLAMPFIGKTSRYAINRDGAPEEPPLRAHDWSI